MSNKPYDADYREASREQEEQEQLKVPTAEHGDLPARSARGRATEHVNEWQSAEEEKAILKEERKAPLWVRMLLWILRKSIAPILMIVLLLSGLYIGYVILGGQPKEDVFQWSTWKHMWDLIFADS